MKKNSILPVLGCLAAAVLTTGCNHNDDDTEDNSPQTVNVDALPAAQPRLSTSGTGDLVVVWQEVAEEERADSVLDTVHANATAYPGHETHSHFEVYKRSEVWSRRYQAADETWADAALLQAGDWVMTGRVVREADGTVVSRDNVAVLTEANPSVVLNSQGNGFALWQEVEQFEVDATSGVTRPVVHVWSAAFDPTNGQWTSVAELDQAAATRAGPNIATGDPLDARSPSIAVNANGHAVAAWRQFSDADDDANGYADSIYAVYAARFTANGSGGGTWGTPERISDAGQAAGAPIATIDGNGNALVVFAQRNAALGQTNLYARRYNTTNTAWDPIAAVSSGDTPNPNGEIDQVAVATNAAGQAVAVWTEWDDITGRYDRHVYASRFQTVGGWSTPQRLSDPGLAGSSQAVLTEQPVVALDEDGNATALWVQYLRAEDSSGFPTRREVGAREVWATRFTAGAWATATALASDDQLDAELPRVIATGTNTAVAAWVQRSSPLAHSAYNVYTRTFDGSAWGTSTLISDGASASADLDMTATADGVWLAWRRVDDQQQTVEVSRLQP